MLDLKLKKKQKSDVIMINNNYRTKFE